MCILFLYANPRPSPGAYRLILAMNRDEMLARPAAPASWNGADGKETNMLAGRDLQSGKEGGTWLGVDRQGRVGALTNVSTAEEPAPGAKGRGGIVGGFLFGGASAKDYIETVAADKSKYSPFNLCLLEMDDAGVYSGQYYCRGKEGHPVKSEGPSRIETGFFGLSNHPRSRPYLKTETGLSNFEKAVGKINSRCSSPSEAVADLTKIMCDKTPHHPDEQMKTQATGFKGDETADFKLKGLSSIFVDMAPIYATRAHTFILVDHDRNVTFVEKMRPDGEGNDDWKESTFNFAAKQGGSSNL